MTIREKGDVILHKMSAFQNYGTGRPEFINQEEWESVTTKDQMNKKICDLWRELYTIDPERANVVKPQNPHVK